LINPLCVLPFAFALQEATELLSITRINRFIRFGCAFGRTWLRPQASGSG